MLAAWRASPLVAPGFGVLLLEVNDPGIRYELTENGRFAAG
jgi:hypothetical protein